MAHGDLEPLYRLRSRLRPWAVSRRVADCGLRVVSATPALVVRVYAAPLAQDTEELQGKPLDERRSAWWRGVLRCGRQHSCPVCAAQRAADRAAELDSMMRGDDGGRWQMLTLTMRHHRGDSLSDLLDRLFAAWRRVRSVRAVREIMDRTVTASVRALEVTFSFQNGWHPHLHVLWRTEEWTEEERATLALEWLRALDDRAAPVHVAVRWSTPIGAWCAERAAYLSKLGAEVAGVSKHSVRNDHPSLHPFQVAERGFLALWSEYQRAMVGRRVLEMDERARALADQAPDNAPELRAETAIVLHADEYRALAQFERCDPGVLWLVLDCVLSPMPWADVEGVGRSTILDLLRADVNPRAG